jgi:hypothetical protein
MKGGRFWWNKCLREITEGKAEIGLAEACRNLEWLFQREGVTDKVRPALVSHRLRDIGFAKTGMIGCGHDREPLYRRQIPAQAAQ